MKTAHLLLLLRRIQRMIGSVVLWWPVRGRSSRRTVRISIDCGRPVCFFENLFDHRKIMINDPVLKKIRRGGKDQGIFCLTDRGQMGEP